MDINNTFIKSRLNQKQILFVENLQDLIQTKIYFYGSIERKDYFNGKSDIDADIFPANVQSTLFKLRQIGNIPNNQVNYIKWSLFMPELHKFQCIKVKVINNQVSLEINIYNQNKRNEVLNARKYQLQQFTPTLQYILMVFKKMHYEYGIISIDLLMQIKIFLYNNIAKMTAFYLQEKIE